MRNLCFHEYVLKKVFLPLKFPSLGMKMSHYGPRPFLSSKFFYDIAIKFNKLSETLYFFEKLLDLIELFFFFVPQVTFQIQK